MMRTATVTLALAGSLSLFSTQEPSFHTTRPFGTLRQQAEIQQGWVEERIAVNLPKVMRDHGVDMWVVPMREYNEDPVFRALVAPTSFAARRRTIYVFTDRGRERGVESLALGGGSQGGLYEAYRGRPGRALGLIAVDVARRSDP